MIVILYVMDALRPDFLGCYGFDKSTSPNIDGLAKDGVLYENAYSTATWTKAAAASIVTSQYPRTLEMMYQTDVMPKYENTLPRVLKKVGFQTYAISANAFFSPDFGFSGFDEFFVLQKDEELLKKRKKGKDPSRAEVKILEKLGIDKIVMVLSEDINERVFPILEKDKKANKFIMIWSADTHGPYYVKGDKSFFSNSLDDLILEKEVNRDNLEKVKMLYCDMIRYNDYHFGKLVLKLKEEGLYEDSLIIIASDHGEAFGEHNLILGRPMTGHAGIAYEEVIKVPLIIKYPQNKFAGKRYKPPVQLTDIYPTILDICKIGVANNEVEGFSLNPARNNFCDDRVIFVESQLTPDSTYSAAIRKGNYKLIKVKNKLQMPLHWKKFAKNFLCKLQISAIQFYDLSSDPEEKRNLKRQKRALVKKFLDEYYKVKTACEQKAEVFKEKEKGTVNEETEKRLKALGYLD